MADFFKGLIGKPIQLEFASKMWGGAVQRYCVGHKRPGYIDLSLDLRLVAISGSIEPPVQIKVLEEGMAVIVGNIDLHGIGFDDSGSILPPGDVEVLPCSKYAFQDALEESDRQMMLLAMAELALSRPGFNDALYKIAEKLKGAQMFEGFKETSADLVGDV